MNTTPQQIPQGLDPTAFLLTKAIKQQETGGSTNQYTAVGKSGEYGAYQYTPETWASDSQKYLGQTISLNQATPAQQNQVAYSKVKDLLAENSGSQTAVASIWNSGHPDPNTIGTGTNKYGAQYDVPGYVNGVKNHYLSIQKQFVPSANIPTDQTSTSTQDEAPSVGGFLKNAVSSVGNVIGGIGNAVMHPIKTLENIGSTAVGAAENASNLVAGTDFNDSQTQTASNVGQYFANRYGGSSPGEIAQNVLKTAYKDPAGVALDLSTLLDGAGAGIGTIGKLEDASNAADVANAASKGTDFIAGAKGIIDTSQPVEASTATQIAKNLKNMASYTNPLAPFAKAIGGTVQGLANLSDSIPRRIMNNLLPQLKDSTTIDYAINNTKLGSVDSMVSKSESALNSYNTQIKAILNHPDYADTTIDGTTVAGDTLKKFPNSEYTPSIVFSKIKNMIPGSAALVTKLEKGILSLDEANTLRQAIDQVTYKTIIDSPEIRAGKELAAAFGNSLRENVKTLAPETRSIFSDYAKEVNLRKALTKLSLKSAKKGAVSMKELLIALGAAGVTGPIGGLGSLALEKLINLPASKVGLAKMIKRASSIGQKTAGIISKASPYLKEASMIGKISGASQN